MNAAGILGDGFEVDVDCLIFTGRPPPGLHAVQFVRAASDSAADVAAAYERSSRPVLLVSDAGLAAEIRLQTARPVATSLVEAKRCERIVPTLVVEASAKSGVRNRRKRFDVAAHLAAMPYHESDGRTAAVTCYFNPQRSAARLRCYETFARQFPRIGLELFTAEGSVDGRHDIPGAWQFVLDSDAHLFAKENLLNLAIARLPDRFERVLWVDADVLLLAKDYRDLLATALDTHEVVQGFAGVQYLGRHGEPQTRFMPSLAAANARNGTAQAEVRGGYPGLAWAASREVLAAAGGLYDRVITGGGDVAWTMGLWNDPRPAYSRQWPAALVADIQRWAARLRQRVASVGVVQSDSVHLYHGAIASRQYLPRNRILREVGYDPTRDTEYAPNGTLRWSPAAPAKLRQAVRTYIHGRKEDQ